MGKQHLGRQQAELYRLAVFKNKKAGEICY